MWSLHSDNFIQKQTELSNSSYKSLGQYKCFGIQFIVVVRILNYHIEVSYSDRSLEVNKYIWDVYSLTDIVIYYIVITVL